MSNKIDVFIPTFNSMPEIKRLLKSIKYEIPINRIIIVDGGSSDGTIQFTKSEGATVLFQTHPGVGAARALALDLIETPIFASFDSDVQITPGWYKIMVKIMDDPHVAVAASIALYGQPGSALEDFFKWGYEVGRRKANLCAVLLRTDLIKNVGGFNPDYKTGEDVDLYRKIVKTNSIKWITVENVIVRHPQTLQEFFLHSAWYGHEDSDPQQKAKPFPIRFIKAIWLGLRNANKHPAIIIILPLAEIWRLFGHIEEKFVGYRSPPKNKSNR